MDNNKFGDVYLKRSQSSEYGRIGREEKSAAHNLHVKTKDDDDYFR